jgi:hypothetical protein
MYNRNQFKGLIERVLTEIPGGYSPEAVELLIMIAAHESKSGTYLRQRSGPALGVFQIEPETHDDVWENGDTCPKNAQIMGIEWSECRLEYDLRYQIFIARQKLFMVSEQIPEEPIDMASYAKKYWNTNRGKATHLDYLLAYNAYK